MYQRVSDSFGGNWAEVGGDIIGDVLFNKPEIPSNLQIQRQEDEINGEELASNYVEKTIDVRSLNPKLMGSQKVQNQSQNVESKDFEINIRINLKLNIITE